MGHLKKSAIVLCVFLIINLTFGLNSVNANEGDHCYNALSSCTQTCQDAWVDMTVDEQGAPRHPMIAIIGLGILGACGNGCLAGYTACLIIL